jgi:hypothetical protein
MTSRRFAALLFVLALFAAGSAGAVGPLDGSYATTVVAEDLEYPLYVVVLQNENQNPNFGMALLDPELGIWYYGFGALDDQQHVTGPIIDPYDPIEIGQFDLRFKDGAVTGTLTLYEVPHTISGGKFF